MALYHYLKDLKLSIKRRPSLRILTGLFLLTLDAIPVSEITEEEFFSDKPFFGVHHPCHALGMPPHTEYPGAFETNPKSRAHVTPDDDTTMYWQGCLWGGKVPADLI